MLTCMLRAKIHEATVTDANLHYEGSLNVDTSLLDAVGIKPYEKVLVSNLNNGERFETYVIPSARGSGEVVLNGPAARKGMIGDKIIIFSYAYYTEEDLKDFSPRIIRLDRDNRIVKRVAP